MEAEQPRLAQEPLLSSNDGVDPAYFESKNVRRKASRLVLLSVAKWVLKITMWVIFIAWVVLLFLMPSLFGSDLYDDIIDAISGALYGETGATFLVMGGPILLIAFLAIPYLIVRSKEEEEQLQERRDSKSPTFRLSTFPVLVRGPFGVVSAAELIGILLFVVFVIWAIYSYTIVNIILLPSYGAETPEEARIIMVRQTAYIFGLTALSCLAFLFLPVARGSILLRLINIPFEHAIRYHIWLGNLIFFILTLHGLTYVAEWIMKGEFLSSLFEWKSDRGANLAGVICYCFFLVMWVTSLPPVRRQNFELFMYAHQLYVVFVIFMALHIGATFFSKAAAGIFIFMLDRFLRFFQSRKTVTVKSATCFPCGSVQLILSKPAKLQYNALGFVFLQVKELSKLQWHPFSVSSSPLDGKNHLSLLIKSVGDWTGNLKGTVSIVSGGEPQIELPFQPHLKITASVEGPYGHESLYYLTYENVVLVAGGSGISAFVAILSDIIHRIQEGKPCLTRHVLLVWAVKRSNEIPLLYTAGVKSVSPYLLDKLKLEIQTYVTQESDSALEEGKADFGMKSSVFSVHNGSSMSVLVGTGTILWPGIYLVTSTVGFAIILGLLDYFYINPLSISKWWYLGILFLGSMAGAVLIFGGSIIGLWHHWVEVSSGEEGMASDLVEQDEPATQGDACREYFSRSNTILYGYRPNFKEIFGVVAKNWGHVDVGVISCGPQSLQSSVAKECRSQNLTRRSENPVFHFHSHSFQV
ncbi:Ferric-chelate reductase (NADH) [Bertholletia excelsa]